MFEWLKHVRIQTIGNAINAALLFTALVVGLSSTMVLDEARHMADTWERFDKGAATKAIVGQPFDLLIPLRFREIYKRYLRKFGNATTTVRMMDETGDISGLRADGSVFPAQASISKIDRNGEQIFTVIIRDITEQTLARKRLLDMAKFPNEDPNPVLRVTADGQVLYANPTAREFGALFESADLRVLGVSLATEAWQALESESRAELEFEADSFSWWKTTIGFWS